MVESRQLAIELQQDIAADKPYEQMVKRLQGRLADEIKAVCSVPIDNRTAFQAIAAHDKAKLLEFILSQGVNIEDVDASALNIAVSQKAKNTTHILLKHGASPAQTGPDGKTAVHVAAENGFNEILRDLLDNGGVEIVDELEFSGCSALTLACMGSYEETALMLIESGAKVDLQARYPPLHSVAFLGNFNLVRTLLRKGASVNLQDAQGETALHYAAFKGHKKVIQALLENDAQKDIVDNNGKTAERLARTEDIREMLKSKTNS